MPNRRYIYFRKALPHHTGLYKCTSSGPGSYYNAKTFDIHVLPKKDLQEWSDWSPWSQCTGKCSQGHQRRVRSCISKTACTGSGVEVRICLLPPCPHRTYEELSSAPGEVAWNGERNFKSEQPKRMESKDTSSCPEGHSWDLFANKCRDINECKRKDTCPKPLACINTIGSYKCFKCPEGFIGANHRCVGELNQLFFWLISCN